MATNAADLDSIADSLPIDRKIDLIDRLLKSISPTDGEMDELWKTEVESRIDEVENGKVKTIPSDEVFDKARERFRK